MLFRSIRHLGEHLRALQLDEVIQRFESDKKHGAENYTLILVAADGRVQLQRLPKSAAIRRNGRDAIQTIVEKYSR